MTKSVVTNRVSGVKMVKNALAAWLRPGPR